MLLKSLAFFAAVAPCVFADVKFTTPAAGAVLSPGTLDIKWKDSGDAPSISDLKSYQLFLCAGGNEEGQYTQLSALQTQGEFSSGNAASGTVAAGLGGSTTNAYFLMMISVATAGGTVTNFSPRFTLSGMTGVFPANVISGVKGVTGTDGPDTINNVASNTGAASGEAGGFGVPYNSQTGLTRYAPMQPIPPTSITATVTTPLWPTSAVTIAKTWMAIPSPVTTLTQSQTFSVSSRENTVAAASQPTDDMSRFLARWKD